MLTTAGLMAANRPIAGRRMGVVMPSGGLCDIIADDSAELDLALPDFTQPTRAALTDLLPDYARPDNPLDLTGVVVTDPSVAERARNHRREGPARRFRSVPLLRAVAGRRGPGSGTIRFEVASEDDR